MFLLFLFILDSVLYFVISVTLVCCFYSVSFKTIVDYVAQVFLTELQDSSISLERCLHKGRDYLHSFTGSALSLNVFFFGA